MRDKVLFGSIVFLIVVVLFQGFRMYFLKREINSVLQEQIDEYERLKDDNGRKTDSIELLRKNKETVIVKKEQLLYSDIAKANENNTYYEGVKKNISHADNADSLARQLTKRYAK